MQTMPFLPNKLQSSVPFTFFLYLPVVRVLAGEGEHFHPAFTVPMCIILFQLHLNFKKLLEVSTRFYPASLAYFLNKRDSNAYIFHLSLK